MRKEICVKCNTEWGVSESAKLRKIGYVCPWCREKEKKRKVAEATNPKG